MYASKQYFVSSAENNRFPALWCLDDNQDKKAESSVATFAVDDAARFLNVKLIENVLNLCVVTVSGALHYFKVDMDNAQSKKPIKPKLVMRIVADSTEEVLPIKILAATIQSADSVKVAYGEMNLLQSETIVSANEVVQIRGSDLKIALCRFQTSRRKNKFYSASILPKFRANKSRRVWTKRRKLCKATLTPSRWSLWASPQQSNESR
jgi:hypothetical protein